jgi:hypothetical protein
MPKSPKLIVIRCIECPHEVSALSEAAAMQAFEDHRYYETVIKKVETCQ